MLFQLFISRRLLFDTGAEYWVVGNITLAKLNALKDRLVTAKVVDRVVQTIDLAGAAAAAGSDMYQDLTRSPTPPPAAPIEENGEKSDRDLDLDSDDSGPIVLSAKKRKLKRKATQQPESPEPSPSKDDEGSSPDVVSPISDDDLPVIMAPKKRNRKQKKN